MAEYVNPATVKETDPYLYSQRGALSGLMALPGSGQTLSPAEFSALLGGGRTYDPTFGIYQQDPRNMSDVERVRQNMLNSTGNPGRTVTDSAGNVYRLPRSSQTTRIGDKQYFVNPDGTVTSYDVQDINYDFTPGFAESTKEVQGSKTEGSSMARYADIYDSVMNVDGFDPTNSGVGITGQARASQRERAKEQVDDIFREYLGRNAEGEAGDYYGEQIFQALASGSPARYQAIIDEIKNSAEGQAFAQRGSDTGASDTSTGATEDVTDTKPRATEADLQALYQELLGGPARPEAVEYWLGRGMTVDSLRNAIAQSPEGLEFAETGEVSERRQEYIDSLSADTPALPPGLTAEVAENFQFILDRIAEGNATEGQKDWYNNQYLTGNYLNNPENFVATKNYDDQLNQYYRELFNRDPSQAGLDYFNQRLRAGAYDPANLRNVLINEASPIDRMYYEGTQSGDPVFSATQALFGRNPARGVRLGGGEFEGGYGQYMRNLQSGDLTEDQLRRDLVNLAYERDGPEGKKMGTGRDYQAYLNTLGIDRANSPFAIDGGFANVPYGSDLSEFQALADAETETGTGTTPGGGGMPPMPPMPPGKGGRIPGQYITGNQLYSGLPYGVTMPYGMMDFTQSMGATQPMGMMGMTMPPQPYNYGYSSQYMPNRGLMSGYSTGFGPYGGFQRRPRFGGGKGGGFGGGKGGGYNPYATGDGSAGFVAGGPSPTTTPFREQFGTPYFSGRQFGGFRDVPVGGLDNPINYSPNFGFYSGPYNDEFFRRGGMMSAI